MFFFFRIHIYSFEQGKQVNDWTGFSQVMNLNLKNSETFWNSSVRLFFLLCYDSCAWFLSIVWRIRDLVWEVLHLDILRASYKYLIINTKLRKLDKISLFIFLCKNQGLWSQIVSSWSQIVYIDTFDWYCFVFFHLTYIFFIAELPHPKI